MRWVFLPVSLVAVAGFAGEIQYDFSLNGSPLGSSVVRVGPEGRLESTTMLKVMGTEIKSVLRARRAEGAYAEFKMELTDPNGTAHLERVGDKFVATGPRRPKLEIAPKNGFRLILANFHPELLTDLFEAAKKDGEKLPLFLTDSMTMADATVKFLPSETRLWRGNRVSVAFREIKVGAVALKVGFSPGGEVLGMDVPSQRFRIVARGAEGLFEDPMAKHPELSQATFKTKTIRQASIPMRDGTILRADIAMPVGEGPFPTILTRTPYGRAGSMLNEGAEDWAARGYVFVSQDVRGRGDSGGLWDPFLNERRDGHDTLAWIAIQPWSNQRIGMIGASYVGGVQWQAAVGGHPALKAIVPQVSPPDPMFNLPYDYGIPMLAPNLWWLNLTRDRDMNPFAGMGFGVPNAAGFKTLPLTEVDQAVYGREVPLWDTWMQRHRPQDWTGWNFEQDLKHTGRVPALMISGWWDGDGIGTKRIWERRKALGMTDQSWLIYGPWPHAFNASTTYLDQDYGPSSVLDLREVYLQWFDTWLKGKAAGLDKAPRTRVFVTGANRWHDAPDFPDPKATARALYLTKGMLQSARPRAQAPSRHAYDPAKVRLIPGAATTIWDPKQTPMDELVFRTAPMTRATTVTGPVRADLFVSTTAQDADLFASVVDIDPKGTIRMIGLPGKLRLSYWNRWSDPQPVTPNKVYRVQIDHWDIAHEFKRGHRLGLVLTSDFFPAWSRNLGYGDPPATAKRMRSAIQSIYHDPKRPSRLTYFEIKQ